MRALLVLLVAAAALAAPFTDIARGDTIDVELVQLEQTAQQWWAGYGLTVDMPYAAGDVTNGGRNVLPGCGDAVRILRTADLNALGVVDWPHGCDMRLNETLVRAGLTAGPRTDWLNQQLAAAGLNPRGSAAAAALLCAVMIHETGHVLGLAHEPTGIMREGAPAPPPTCVVWAASARPWRAARAGLRGKHEVARRHRRAETQVVDR